MSTFNYYQHHFCYHLCFTIVIVIIHSCHRIFYLVIFCCNYCIYKYYFYDSQYYYCYHLCFYHYFIMLNLNHVRGEAIFKLLERHRLPLPLRFGLIGKPCKVSMFFQFFQFFSSSVFNTFLCVSLAITFLVLTHLPTLLQGIIQLW